MKLTFLCLFAFCCYSLVSSSTDGNNKSQQERKLDEVLSYLKEFRNSLQHSEQQLITPPRDIEDCCCLTALKCFKDNLPGSVSGAEKKRVMLYKSLGHRLTEQVFSYCDTGNTGACQACAAHPKQNTTIFFKRLEDLIKTAVTRLRIQ